MSIPLSMSAMPAPDCSVTDGWSISSPVDPTAATSAQQLPVMWIPRCSCPAGWSLRHNANGNAPIIQWQQ